MRGFAAKLRMMLAAVLLLVGGLALPASATTPGSPTFAGFRSGSNAPTATISWNAPNDPGSSPIAQYRVRLFAPRSGLLALIEETYLAADVREYTFTKLESESLHEAFVWAINDHGDSEPFIYTFTTGKIQVLTFDLGDYETETSQTPPEQRISGTWHLQWRPTPPTYPGLTFLYWQDSLGRNAEAQTYEFAPTNLLTPKFSTNPNAELLGLTIDGNALPGFDGFRERYQYKSTLNGVSLAWKRNPGSKVQVSSGYWPTNLGSPILVPPNQNSYTIPVPYNSSGNVPFWIGITTTSEDGEAVQQYLIRYFPISDPNAASLTLDFEAGAGASGTTPTTIVSVPDLVQLPDEGNLSNGTKVFAGWMDSSGGLHSVDELFELSSSQTLTAHWIEDAVDQSLLFNAGSVIQVDSENADLARTQFELHHPSRAYFQLGGMGRSVLRLYNSQQNQLDTIDTETTYRRYLNLGSSCPDSNNPACISPYYLEIDSYSPSGNLLITREIVLLATFTDIPWQQLIFSSAEYSWYVTHSQGWLTLPLSPYPPDTNKVISHYEVGVDRAGPYLPGQQVAKMNNEIIYAMWKDIDPRPTSFTLFGAQASFADCEAGASEQCLFVGNDKYSQHTGTPGSYYVTLDVDLANPHDRRIGTAWQDYMTSSIQVTSLDFRRIRNGGISETFASEREFSQEELCPSGLCTQVFEVKLSSSYLNLEKFGAKIYVLLDTSYPWETFNVTARPEVDLEPTVFKSAIPAGWISFPTTQDYAYEGFVFAGWTVEPLTKTLLRTIQRFPVLQDSALVAFQYRLSKIQFFNGSVLILERQAESIAPLAYFMPTTPVGETEFLGWATSAGGTPVPQNTTFDQDTALYAVWAAAPEPEPVPQVIEPEVSPPGPSLPTNPVLPAIPPAISEPTPPALPEPESSSPVLESALAPISSQTMTAVRFVGGRSEVEAVVPAKYVNRPARIEIRRVIGGKVRYYLIGKAWTHYDRKRNDFTKAAMTFRFPLELKPEDVIRVKVRGVQVIRATGEGKPAGR